jgi:hypothetical protein
MATSTWKLGAQRRTMYLQAVTLDPGTVAIGAFDNAGMKRVAPLSEHEQPLLSLPYWKGITIEVRSIKSPS